MSEQMALSRMVERLIELASRQKDELSGRSMLEMGDIAFRLADLRAEVAALRAMTYMGVSRNVRREAPGPESSFLRLSVGELIQRITQLALDVLGPEGVVWTDPVRRAGNWSNDYLYSLSRTISAGTKDIQRNLIGERVLGLPR